MNGIICMRKEQNSQLWQPGPWDLMVSEKDEVCKVKEPRDLNNN